MEKKSIVYLAGKTLGIKWKLINGLRHLCTFVASDTDPVSSDGQVHDSHMLGCEAVDKPHATRLTKSNAHVGCEHGGGWDCGCTGGGCGRFFSEPRKLVANAAIDLIRQSNFVIAIAIGAPSPGTIAEMAFASALGKKVYAIIPDPSKEILESGEYQPPETIQIPYEETEDHYWFVCNFPNVTKIEVGTFDDATKAIKKILCRNDYKLYLQTEEWKERRDEVRKKFRNRCVICNKEGPCDVHHRNYENLGNEEIGVDDNDIGDLVLLCRSCHERNKNCFDW